ncbi:MAG TPA: hypothetical protein DD640_08230 [Clostridiales bacterium]|nr:hypothetical protein [Clostridiales bacterium]
MFALFAITLLLLSGLATHIYGSGRTVKTIAAPLVRLAGAVSAMSEGNLKDPIVEQGDEEIRQLQRSMEVLRLKLQESLAMREKIDENRQMLVSSISHDLKTPITSIRGYVEGLLDGVADTPEKQRKYLETISRKAGQLDKMIDDLVFYSRLELDQVPYHFVWTDPVLFLSELVEDARELFGHEGIALDWENQLKESCWIRIDRAQMQRVLANLFDNARKYRKGHQDHVTVTLRDKQEHIIIDIADTGIGIPPESLPYLFDRFFRADSARSKAEGSGLGLAIARQIVEDHKGSIWVRSKEQAGTTFSIALKKEAAWEHKED